MKDQALKRLGFTEDWLKYGILSEDYLLKLFNEIETSDDKNAEHYRGWAFQQYIKNKKSLSDTEIDIIIALQDNGPDLCDLHENRIYEILYSNLLTDEQLERLPARYPAIIERPFSRLYKRITTIRLIIKNGLNEETFGRVKLSADSEVQLYALDQNGIDYEQAEWLAINGNNKKVRNIAEVVKRRLKKVSI